VKRKWLIGALLAGPLLIGACSVETSSDENGDGIGQGFGSEDASGDVSVGDCETDFGIITCDVTIVNSSDGMSDYYIEATVEDSSGAKVGSANTLVSGVEGGQTAKDALTGTFSGKGKDLSVRLTEVQRTAS
jgi:hypothetical protein